MIHRALGNRTSSWASELTPGGETELLQRWAAELSATAAERGLKLSQVRLFHWGLARIPLPELNWFDLLENTVLAEPVGRVFE